MSNRRHKNKVFTKVRSTQKVHKSRVQRKQRSRKFGRVSPTIFKELTETQKKINNIISEIYKLRSDLHHSHENESQKNELNKNIKSKYDELFELKEQDIEETDTNDDVLNWVLGNSISKGFLNTTILKDQNSFVKWFVNKIYNLAISERSWYRESFRSLLIWIIKKIIDSQGTIIKTVATEAIQTYEKTDEINKNKLLTRQAKLKELKDKLNENQIDPKNIKSI
jgi:hypothetical protein